VNLGTLAADTTNLLRIIIYRWHPSASSAPSATSILQYTGLQNAPNSPYYHDQRRLFTVIYDHTFPQVLVGDNSNFHINKVFKLRPKEISFNAGTTNGSEKLFMLVISDSGAAPNPGLVGYLRLSYTDH